MIGYLILLAFWVLATLTLFALSIPFMRKRATKITVAGIVALLSAGVYTIFAQSLERVWWVWVLLVLSLGIGAFLSVFVERRDVEREVSQRTVK